MSSISFDSDDDIHSLSTIHVNNTSNSPTDRRINDINSSSSNIYTPEQIKHFLFIKDQRFYIDNNISTKPLACWWRSFGYVYVKNKKNEFEKINGFISCFKCYSTYRYGSSSGTKHFTEHADRCFPLSSANSTLDERNDSKLVQCKLNQVGFRRKATLTVKEKHQLKELHAKWICTDLRPFTIVQDYGFEHLANMFIKIGKKTPATIQNFMCNLLFTRSCTWNCRC